MSDTYTTSSTDTQDSVIREVLRDHARLKDDAATIDESADLYQSGMTSHASVNVMLALEGAFDVEFPDHMLKRTVFSSIASIRQALSELSAA
ncbi:acyl carrier protein [Caenimonas aquaedulcis]|uniref:Acyl carrier protein n=1 Tax=Caenimonas aquaedulcis TaxID=2793270 RepID=A0A931H7F2_9BURK|nr:acyl carrier protein [Caenimonas aquaedulcis]MBG9390070.1 acyl carrier protein [Caenimonas aquaedulcis]